MKSNCFFIILLLLLTHFYGCRDTSLDAELYSAYEDQITPPSIKTELYLIHFKDKGNQDITKKEAFLSKEAIDKRAKHAITTDQLDLPVYQEYIDEIKTTADIEVMFATRWFNALVIATGKDFDKKELEALGFVQKIESFGERKELHSYEEGANSTERITQKLTGYASNSEYLSGTEINFGSALNTLEFYKNELPQQGFLGQGITIALMGQGFLLDFEIDQEGEGTNLEAIAHLGDQRQIIDTYNFHRGDHEVDTRSWEGHIDLEFSASILPDQFVAPACKAKYALYVPESSDQEEAVDELLWVSALERADSLGVHIVNSRNIFGSHFDDPNRNIPFEKMDGKTAYSSRAVNIAMSKGMLVINTMPSTKVPTPPTDASYTIVGSGISQKFFGEGYQKAWSFEEVKTVDGRSKPDFFSIDQSVDDIRGKRLSFIATGSIFLTANIASLWSALPNKSAKEIYDLLHESKENDDTSLTNYININKAYEIGK
ncbi:hypothetical protein ACFSTE_14485 [Aquimarina hainanensis]|uniref:Subtilase family protein n=1 Tax=Aquimarina hainanensis TaxID=1578017 RepID=A0ABW5NCX5_9FLAO